MVCGEDFNQTFERGSDDLYRRYYAVEGSGKTVGYLG